MNWPWRPRVALGASLDLSGTHAYDSTHDFAACPRAAYCSMFAGIALIWDQPKHKLYLDLNRNLDLTDDPTGAFSSTGKEFQQVLTNVTLPLKTATGLHPAILDLHLFTDAQGRWAQVRLHSRSLWQAKVAPGGEEWQVAVVDNLFGPEGPVVAKFLLLRPWAVRTNRVSFYDPTFGIIPFPSHLFWLGRPFQLGRRFETDGESPVCKLEFTPQQPPLTELKLSGEFVCMQTWEAWERNRVRRFDSFGRCPVFSRCCSRGW